MYIYILLASFLIWRKKCSLKEFGKLFQIIGAIAIGNTILVVISSSQRLT